MKSRMYSPIAHVQVKAVELPLFTPFAISKGAIEQAHLSFVTITDANGLFGIGEIASFPHLTGDTPLGCFEAAKQFGPTLIDVDVWQATLKTLRAKNDFTNTPSMLVGVEMALWDLRAKQMGVPLRRLWGHHNGTEFQTDITLPIMQVGDVGKFCELFDRHKFEIVKVKVGGSQAKSDCERILELKKYMPSQTKITLDGNQGCTLESSLHLVEELARHKIVPLFFEQPLPEDDFAGLTKLTQKSPIPICVDETVKTAADAIKVIEQRACHFINLKFMKSGIQETLEIVAVARAKGVKLMIGGMLESEVAMTCSAHLVCGSGAIDWCDLDTPFFIERRITKASPYHRQSAHLALVSPDATGMGLELTF